MKIGLFNKTWNIEKGLLTFVFLVSPVDCFGLNNVSFFLYFLKFAWSTDSPVGSFILVVLGHPN
jgi:hypothetical protein